MARRELGPASLEVARAVADRWPGGDVVVGVSGGADSLALALGAAWAADKLGGRALAVVVDHGLQPGSADVAARARDQLSDRGIRAEVRAVDVVPGPGGLEAAARDARLGALAADGLPVLLGHTLDDQAEQVFLGLIRGSGARSLAGMPAARPPFLRPLLGIRRATTVAACAQWGIEPWQDPMNADDGFTRVRVRRWLEALEDAAGRSVVPALGRSAALARADADLLDELAAHHVPPSGPLSVGSVRELPDALRWRVLRQWLTGGGVDVAMVHVLAVDALLVSWRGQGPVDVPGARVSRDAGELRLLG